MIMKRPENDKWLNRALEEVIGSEKPRTDFEKWKQKHPEAVEMLTSRAKSKTSTITHPHLIRRIIMKNQITKYAAVVAVVLGLGAIAVVGVNISKIYYKGKTDDGAHIFISDDLETVVTMDEVTDVEQTVRDLEEMKILSQQGKKELLEVKEMMTDGTLRLGTHLYRYQLSDGRTKDLGEGADDMPVYNMEQWKEFRAQLDEFRRLKKAGPGEDLGTYEETVEGRVFSFKRERYFLSDGTEVIWSVGRPK